VNNDVRSPDAASFIEKLPLDPPSANVPTYVVVTTGAGALDSDADPHPAHAAIAISFADRRATPWMFMSQAYAGLLGVSRANRRLSLLH
jgi:hypothetical protein